MPGSSATQPANGPANGPADQPTDHSADQFAAPPAGPRPRAVRRRDTEHRLTHDADVWVASASADGGPYLVPLSFDWDGETLLLATPGDSPTGRNLAATGTARLGLGPTRDVTMIEGEVEVLPIDALSAERGDRFAARTGFDPRVSTVSFRWFRVTPTRVQAWREANELTGRQLMHEGRWLD
ncbi:pyridoxamine 5'-phosphate oxidase family protein [Streptomyces sp. NPDC013978]|uniref:pyridoxamine 5'-phosphate oxidase family protein n=1 Tax=Streptomyces sp. NPDC013978 TaxID=3364869 RepID=UPI0036F690BA